VGSCSIAIWFRINPGHGQYAQLSKTDFADLLREVDALMSQLAHLPSRIEVKARDRDRERDP
jgi:hypothetical protein